MPKDAGANNRSHFFLAFIFVSLCGCVSDENESEAQYITWDGLEPDKWASVWLIKRHVDPGAKVVLRPIGAPIETGIAFGIPGSDFSRSHGVSVYESLMRGYELDDPAVQELGRIVHDIEISPWSDSGSEHTGAVEQAYRALQDRFEKRDVPIACYERFFDQVYILLSGEDSEADRDSLYELGTPEDDCVHQGTSLASKDDSPFVLRLETYAVLDQISAGRKVVFVDVREPAEYDEFRIPGAVNLQLRAVTPEHTSQFNDADLVIPYCVKDFRGFEMARSLAELGVKNVGIMQPYGIAGWRHLGLPVAGQDGLTDAEALDELSQCAQAGNCVTDPS